MFNDYACFSVKCFYDKQGRGAALFRTMIQIDTGFKFVDIDGVINNVGAFDVKNTRE